MNMAALPGLADDGSGLVFVSSWQAEIFSLVVGRHESGCSSWNEWAEARSRQIAEDSNSGTDGVKTPEETNPPDSYYRLWVSALERILADKTLPDSDEVRERVTRWRDAYPNTPRGAPVTLSTGGEQNRQPG